MDTLPTTETFCLETTWDLIWQDQEYIGGFPRKNKEILEKTEVPHGLYLGPLCTRMGLNRSVSEASDGTDVFGAPWKDLGVVGWISRNQGIPRKQKSENHENWEVPDGIPQGSRCDRTGRDRSVSEASDEMDVLGAFWEDFVIVNFGGFRGGTSF